MNEFIQQYLPEITSAIAAFISSGGVLVLVKFMMGKFGELKETVKNDTEIKELRKMIKELTEKQAEINTRCVTLIHQNYELNKMMKEEQNAKQNDNRI